MKKMMTYVEHKKISEGLLTEGFRISKKELPKVGDIVDRIAWKEGDKVAYVDFSGTKNIPIHIDDDVEVPAETETPEAETPELATA